MGQSKLSIGFKCSDLPNIDTTSQSDPFIVFYKKTNDHNWSKIGHTEIIYDNLSPEFVTKVQVDYMFEGQELYKVEVYDSDDANAV